MLQNFSDKDRDAISLKSPFFVIYIYIYICVKSVTVLTSDCSCIKRRSDVITFWITTTICEKYLIKSILKLKKEKE